MRQRWTLVFLFHCGGWQPNPTHHYHLDISPTFSSDQIDAIVAAVTTWQRRSNDFVTFDGDVSSQTDVISFDPSVSHALAQEFGGGTIGVSIYAGQSTHVQIDPTLDPTTFTQTVAHETGHALGLLHTGSGTVMCANTGCAALSVTCADVARVEQGATFSCNDVSN